MTYIMCAERILPAHMCRNEQPKGAREPRRQACSTGRGASGPGLGGGTPTSVLENPKRIFQYIARLLHGNLGSFLRCKRFFQSHAHPPQSLLGAVISNKPVNSNAFTKKACAETRQPSRYKPFNMNSVPS